MRHFNKIAVFGLAGFILFCLSGICPHPSRALRPLDDKGLIDLSPSRDVKPKMIEETRVSAFRHSHKSHLELASCFLKCHRKTDFSASDKTQKQWRMLIENNGHDIFAPISWKNQEEKDQILDFLLKHASNSRSGSEGIGAW